MCSSLFVCRTDPKAPLKGELAHGVRLRDITPPCHSKGAASSPSPSLLRKSTSPKGGGSGEEKKLLVLPRALPLGELSPQVTERAGTPSTALQKSSPLGRAVERMRD